MSKLKPWPFLLIIFFLLFYLSSAGDSLSPSQHIKDGETLTSAIGTFKLGFFSSGVSKERYLGIWFNNIPVKTVVWVANRENPLTDTSGILVIGDGGNLVLRNQAAAVVWSSGPSNASSPTVQLLESGNLVLKEERNGGSENLVWQSFDYPTDTLLAGMKLGWDLRRGLNRYLRSWASTDDPSLGNYTFGVDPRGSPQLVLTNGLSWIYRSGPWNGIEFGDMPGMSTDDIFNYSFVSNQDEIYHIFETKSSSTISRLVVTPSGVVQRFVWLNQNWTTYLWAPYDGCDRYAACGAFGFCNPNYLPTCQCLKGFEPKSPHEWRLRDQSGGCVPKTTLDCQMPNGFLNVTHMKLPDASAATVDINMSLEGCKDMCLRNCSCIAYAPADIRGGGSGCIIWTRDLLDLREFTEGGQDVYIRVAASELDDGGAALIRNGGNRKKLVPIIITVTVVSALLLLGAAACYTWKKKAKNCSKMTPLGTNSHRRDESSGENSVIPLFDLSTLATATDNFALGKKLGEGGFGPVYKGNLGQGQDIAVKRLSKDSVQGLDEFKNEVMLIAKLQHTNLVRLLGCCIQGEERMLIYEYMHNKSLDTFIFDKTKGAFLNWQMRFDIIMGIARGLLYLHQDSRLKIIHRDLKASNVLLDVEMNPKISDFGLARISGDDLKDTKTRRIIGTYGYMSPEYAMDGIFSAKSDVFSFGVVALEIISGQKNRGFYEETHLNLLRHAWNLWNEGNALDLVDELLGSSCPTSEILKCIQVGLLCVQERTKDRPTMSSVVFMLGSESAVLSVPKQPGFCVLRSPGDTHSSPCVQEGEFTVNVLTTTMEEGR